MTVQALRAVNLELSPGEFLAVMGRSGSGKSTLLHILGGLDWPSSGRVLWNERDLTTLSVRELARWRGEHVGFVFQSFNLMPTLTALENVELPLLLRGISAKERRIRAREQLEHVGLARRASHKPAELSGGEQQRVALARALVSDPAMILADEPTGNLDSETGQVLLRLLRNLNERGTTIVLATHDPEAAAFAQRIIRLKDGALLLFS
ncbi:MAG: macrolide ABC transporter ATP-binding protein [Candidatus Fraserbacteria bacterium RBG_16_55_9]|uniref:Macrolide ABC transporter ATP-binding protein n=1 Tax=Fraserbacteria sp. (strain RBG_16_55_9) TaxID=1817864 RepID=A0A1F5UTH5_FRAXR|nr:MAG: macrolide ABC transporter ATP-binding protein [Candidatus Fraserbacteria bacterium RBG_16_55_9]